MTSIVSNCVPSSWFGAPTIHPHPSEPHACYRLSFSTLRRLKNKKGMAHHRWTRFLFIITSLCFHSQSICYCLIESNRLTNPRKMSGTIGLTCLDSKVSRKQVLRSYIQHFAQSRMMLEFYFMHFSTKDLSR